MRQHIAVLERAASSVKVSLFFSMIISSALPSTTNVISCCFILYNKAFQDWSYLSTEEHKPQCLTYVNPNSERKFSLIQPQLTAD